MKRAHPRFSARHTLLVRAIAVGRVERLAKTADLSLGGCLFLCEAGFGVGSMLRILLATRRGVITATARVVHEAATDRGEVQVGAAFVALTAKDRTYLEVLAREEQSRFEPPLGPSPDSEQKRTRELGRDPYLARWIRELRTALDTIATTSRQVLQSPLFPEEADRVQLIHDMAGHLIHCVRHMHGARRSEKALVPWTAKAFPPRVVLRSVLTLVRPKARANGVWLRDEAEESVPEVLEGNGLLFHELLSEVLTTAVRRSAGLRLTATLEWGGDRLRLNITSSPRRERDKPLRLVSENAEPQPVQKTVLGRRLTGLAGALQASLEVNFSPRDGTSIGVELPARPATGAFAKTHAPRKTRRRLFTPPSSRTFEFDSAAHDRIALARFRRLRYRRAGAPGQASA